MAQHFQTGKSAGRIWRIILWGTLLTLLALPALVARMIPDVDWGVADFVLAAALLGSAGLGVELAVGASGDWRYRLAMLLAIALALVTVWANGAVGIIGNEGNPLNRLYMAPLLLGGLAAVVVRFEGRALRWIAAGIGTSQFVIAGIAAAQGHSVWVAALVLGGGWSVSSVLFDRASSTARS